MKSALAVAYFALIAGLPLLAQRTTYDSRIEAGPHVFTWKDAYTEVGIWESTSAEINGGFLRYVNIRDQATATITAGNMDSLEARDDASVLVLGVKADRIATRDRANIDLYGGEQSFLGQVQAGGLGVIRIHGGKYGRVLSWPDLDGRIEVYGGLINTLSSLSQGIVVMDGGEVERLDAGGEAGVSVLDSGTVRTSMSSEADGTLVIAGGYPASDIQLSGNARLIVLHTGGVESDYVSYSLAAFDGLATSTNSAGKQFNLLLDDGYKGFMVSAWSNTNYLSHRVWHGQLELVRVDDNIRAFGLAGGFMLMGFLAHHSQVLQMESSKDLVSWQPWKVAIPGDGNTHVEVIRVGIGDRRFFRLRKWPKPNF